MLLRLLTACCWAAAIAPAVSAVPLEHPAPIQHFSSFEEAPTGGDAGPADGKQPANAEPSYVAGGEVDTTTGVILGRPNPKVQEVSEYLGIPYAHSPVDLLRFNSPVAINKSKEIFYATSRPCMCPGFDLGSEEAWDTLRTADAERNGVEPENQVTLALREADIDEDCLSLSIWTRPQFGEPNKAVLVWLNDGGLSFGNVTDIFEEGPFLAAREDVVVVSLNHRLSIFGFSGAPGLPQNVGLLDQRVGMEWIRTNIANFGGDPSRITLVGQSVDGASVDYYSFANYEKDPIVNAFIQESGTALSLGPVTAEAAAETWYQATMRIGCGSVTSTQTTLMGCMRFVSFDNILAAISGPPGRESIISPLRFAPVVDNKYVFGNYKERAAAGQFIKRPLLIGSTDDDQGIAAPFGEARGKLVPDEVVRYIVLSLFDCAIRDRADLSAAAGVTTFRYRRFGAIPSAEFSYSFKPKPFMKEERWDDIPEGTDEELKAASIGRWIRSGWAAFAKDPENALRGRDYGWPPYKPSADTPGKMAQLQVEGKKGANDVTAARWDDRCKGISSPGTLKAVMENVEVVL